MTLTEDRPAASHSALARRAMIDSQLRTSGVNEPWVLAAIAGVAREDFVPETSRAAAYIDRAIPLGNGRMLAAPLVHARMLMEAAPTAQDKVLLIGDGNGYLAALLRPLAGSLAAADPGALPASGAWSLIIIDGAAEHLPESLSGLLADDGRVVTGLVDRGVTRIAIGRKSASRLALMPVADMGVPVLPEFAAPRRWSF